MGQQSVTRFRALRSAVERRRGLAVAQPGQSPPWRALLSPSTAIFVSSSTGGDAGAGRVVRPRPSFLAAPIVRRQNARLSRTLPAPLARLGIGTQEVAEVNDELVLRGQK